MPISLCISLFTKLDAVYFKFMLQFIINTRNYKHTDMIFITWQGIRIITEDIWRNNVFDV